MESNAILILFNFKHTDSRGSTYFYSGKGLNAALISSQITKQLNSASSLPASRNRPESFLCRL